MTNQAIIILDDKINYQATIKLNGKEISIGYIHKPAANGDGFNKWYQVRLWHANKKLVLLEAKTLKGLVGQINRHPLQLS